MQKPPEPEQEDSVVGQVVISALASGLLHIQQLGTAEDKLIACGLLSMATIVLISPPQPVKPPIQLIHSSQLPENGR